MNAFESHFRSLIVTLLLTALTAGCGGGGGGGGGGTSGGGTAGAAPTVTATSPPATSPPATGVAINTRITATFSTSMDAATLVSPAANFTLACPASASVTGSVAYSASSKTASFTPAADLPANTSCTATITTGAKDTTGVALASNFTWTFTTAASADTTQPTVTLTVPVDASASASTNTRVAATFSEGMDAATITGATFTLTGPGSAAVAGSVSYSAAAKTATFAPAATLAAGTTYTATITAGATDLAGNAMAGGNFAWTFTTGLLPDTTPPTVSLVSPVNVATGACVSSGINATFSEAMDPATITNSTFTVTAGGTPVSGTVFYDAASRIASFRATSALAASTTFTATVTTGVKDLAGNALASNMAWTFTTGTQACASASVTALGAASSFGALGGAAGIANQGTASAINGDIGTTAASTLVTGLHDSVAACIYTQTPQNAGTVNGRIFTAPPSPAAGCPDEGTAATLAIASQAAADAQAAFNSLSPASLPGGTDPGAGELGGLTLAAGVYQAAGGSFQITGADLTLDAQGNANAVWVFQMSNTLTVGGPAAPRSVVLINGAQAKNVFWRVGGTATINAAGGGTMAGTIIASGSMTISASGNATVATLNGRALALNASSVTMTNTAINVPAP